MSCGTTLMDWGASLRSPGILNMLDSGTRYSPRRWARTSTGFMGTSPDAGGGVDDGAGLGLVLGPSAGVGAGPGVGACASALVEASKSPRPVVGPSSVRRSSLRTAADDER